MASLLCAPYRTPAYAIGYWATTYRPATRRTSPTQVNDRQHCRAPATTPVRPIYAADLDGSQASIADPERVQPVPAARLCRCTEQLPASRPPSIQAQAALDANTINTCCPAPTRWTACLDSGSRRGCFHDAVVRQRLRLPAASRAATPSWLDGQRVGECRPSTRSASRVPALSAQSANFLTLPPHVRQVTGQWRRTIASVALGAGRGNRYADTAPRGQPPTILEGINADALARRGRQDTTGQQRIFECPGIGYIQRPARLLNFHGIPHLASLRAIQPQQRHSRWSNWPSCWSSSPC